MVRWVLLVEPVQGQLVQERQLLREAEAALLLEQAWEQAERSLAQVPFQLLVLG